jgi:uncharacterized repeat protein (TIGR01451 family)
MYKLKIFLTSAVFILTMFAAQAQTPGGLSSSTYTFQVWLTPDSYSNSNGGVWTNLITTSPTGNFTQPWANKSTPATSIGANFHNAVGFRAPVYNSALNRMQSAGSIGLGTGDAFTIILVYKANSGNWQYRNILNFAGNSEFDLSQRALGYYYTSPDPTLLSMGWLTTRRDLGGVPFGANAIVTVDNDNNASIKQYLNGNTNPSNVGTALSVNGAATNQIVLGASYYALTGNGERGVDADIQEVIILKRTGTSLMPLNDLQKIHSYLAVKYGITMPTGDYVNSAATAVWTRSINAGFDKNIFGIGHDDASRLNQVQSVSQNDNRLTVYMGTRIEATNEANNSTALKDKDFVMFGSTGVLGNHEYDQPAGTVFANGTITKNINSYTNNFWKAQVTNAGVGPRSQTVNMKLTNSFASYILVSQDSTFKIGATGGTRIYPVSSLTATGVVINDGDYITEAGYQPTPGGSSTDNLTFSVWLTPDSYSNGVWKNNIGDANGDFVQPTAWTGTKTPPPVAVGANFHNTVQFRVNGYTAAPNRMQEEKSINLKTDEAFTFLIVYKAYAPTATNFNYQNILNFDPNNDFQVRNFSLGYDQRGANPPLVMAWPGGSGVSGTTNIRKLGSVPWNTLSLVTVDNSNGQVSTNGIRHYLNSGSPIKYGTSVVGTTTANMILGSGNRANVTGGTENGVGLLQNGSQGINADIQELIMVRRSKTAIPFMADLNGGSDLIKMQTYLALKYGITLANSNYMATNGKIVWDTLANANYNKNIIGIARDDETGLYQKQSVSSTYSGITIYIGDKLQTLNSQNTETLNTMQYFVLGSNGLTTISPITSIPNGTPYGSDKIVAANGLNYKSNAIYKAQFTNLTTMTFNLKASSDYLYAFVSSDSTFVPANTKIYPFDLISKTAKITVDTTYKYIQFTGYATGPGGVSANLCLWLHADDESSLSMENLDASSDSRVANFLYSSYGDGSPIVPAVSSWTDQMRGHTYSYAASGATGNVLAAQRMPVYNPNNLFMNFHPSVEFYGGKTGAAENTWYGSYLTNPNGILTAAGLPPNGHTAYFVTSNRFNSAKWIYPMMFQAEKAMPVPTSTTDGYTNYAGPGYGIQQLDSAAPILLPYQGHLVGRFRTSTWQGAGSTNLFQVGATSISGYYQTTDNINTANNKLLFRFNGREDAALIDPDGAGGSADSNPISIGGFNMSSPSTLGTGARFDRTLLGVMSEVIIYDTLMNSQDRRKVESYLAIKYGVTLRPSNTATERFDYTLSNNTVFWPGDVDSTDVTNGKYAKFYNNVAAVIRDDAAKLYNPQSHSTDAGSILHMGVAGKSLGKNYVIGDIPNDQEAVVWGANDQKGVQSIPMSKVDSASCAQFENIFKKKWMVRKLTQGDRPITMLVGAENNSGNNLGNAISADTDFANMYAALSPSNAVTMIVADDPDKLEYNNPKYGDFLALVPMTYMNGELQCSYTFTQDIVYVTFGYKEGMNGCYSDVIFPNTLTYGWNVDYPRKDYKINAPSLAVRKIPATPVTTYLGNDISISTQILYDINVQSQAYYPRFTSNPVNGLEIQRLYGAPNSSTVTTTMKFSSSIIPSFSISDLDNYNAQQDVVTIWGFCKGVPTTPLLLYGQTPATSCTYTIVGNVATTKVNAPTVENTDSRGRVDVTFSHGVDSVAVIYTIASRKPLTADAKYITISSIKLKSNRPAPTFNEDNLAFTKDVAASSITTCEPVEYTFKITNANDKNKYVSFSDTLPVGMTWKSYSLDTLNAAINPSVKNNIYTGTRILKIDSLLVPCGNEILFFATAVMDTNAQEDNYANSANITYDKLVSNKLVGASMRSQDALSLDPLTMFYASKGQKYDTLQMTATVEPVKYSEGKELLVTLDINNPNVTPDITDVFLKIGWDAGFEYVAGSWQGADESYVYKEGSDSLSHLEIAGGDVTDGSQGFILTDGHSIFTFKLKAPAKSNLVEAPDVNGDPIAGDIAPINISFEFNSEMQDACILGSIKNLSGVLVVPYSGGRSFIIVNKHITSPSSFLQLK